MRDSAGFDAFYEAGSRRLVGQVFAMTGDLGEAEDAVQEAYIRAWQHWPKIEKYENPEAWVRSVAFRLCVNAWWKAKNRRTAQRRAAALHEYAPELGPDLLALIRALRELPDKQRLALVLHYFADLTVEQIATETGVSVGTVKSRLSRGRAAMAPLVSEFDSGDTDTPGQPPLDTQHHGLSKEGGSRRRTAHVEQTNGGESTCRSRSSESQTTRRTPANSTTPRTYEPAERGGCVAAERAKPSSEPEPSPSSPGSARQ